MPNMPSGSDSEWRIAVWSGSEGSPWMATMALAVMGGVARPLAAASVSRRAWWAGMSSDAASRNHPSWAAARRTAASDIPPTMIGGMVGGGLSWIGLWAEVP